ncbi:MAG: two-component regulator propeller domain-containing protein [Bacteroidota bacterium]
MRLLVIIFFLQIINLYSQSDRWIIYNKNNSGLPTNSIQCVIQDKDKNYWIGTYDAGLVFFNGKDWILYDSSNSKLPHNNIKALTVDKKGELWIGTYGGGLVHIKNEEWIIYNMSNSDLPDDGVYSLAVDSKNNIWIGTSYEGLVKFDGISFQIFNTSNSKLTANKITSVFVDEYDNVWIGTTEETFLIKNGEWFIQHEIFGECNDYGIYQINSDKQGRILFAYKYGSLGIYDGKEYKSYNKNNSDIPFLGFQSVACDLNNKIWLTSIRNGALSFQNNSWIHLLESNSDLPDKHIFYVYVDDKNNKWFCTYFGGIAIYNEDSK